MQFDVTTGNYFGTLMSRLVDESRRLLKEDGKSFDPTPEAHKIQNDMCIAGDYLRLLDPPTMIIQNVPQSSTSNIDPQPHFNLELYFSPP